ncbi:DUF4244 domain-containing protein [Nonomuraea sp. CA-143628]|uniref:DUF4244 domain-containing protein n=1 Tax=Nonomuraea sp. CA-143628 TaxID=3239997 RepID=UPI003D933734
MRPAATTPNAAATPSQDRPIATPSRDRRIVTPSQDRRIVAPSQDRPITKAASPAVRHHGWLADRWARCSGRHRERGMSTAEYAVGTIAACAFAALLFKVVNSPEVHEMLSKLIDKALNTAG